MSNPNTSSEEELRNKISVILEQDNNIEFFGYADKKKTVPIVKQDITKMADKLLALFKAYGIDQRIDELKRLNTNRHYGKDYQESLDELDSYREKRIKKLKSQKGGEPDANPS